jgi:alpha-amylase/alpha-mannosidase (GH57 family)
VRALCLHGHFYQPPREHPWLGVVEPEPSAAPYRDWNARITAECYRPNAAARVLDPAGRLRALVNTYAWTSFNVGPTLLAWLAAQAPDVIDAFRAGDAAGRERTGWGNAWAQAYGHPILPLSSPRDVRTQVLWGRRDFEHRFGRVPDGMWLPEMAVDATALAALADAGIGLTMLAPHQARRIRPLGTTAWGAVTPETLDTRRLYRWVAPGGAHVDVVFRDEALSRDVAFGPLLRDGSALADRLRAALAEEDGTIVCVAADGETYGHHHRFGEMALGFALRELAADADLVLAGPAAFRARHPPTYEVEIAERTSWSCTHGVERWRAGCGCRVDGPPEWSQAWRAALREAIDWLRDELAVFYGTRAASVLRDPWRARDRYVDCLLEPERTAAWLAAEAGRPLDAARSVEARRLLELSRHALLMQTSCGWFFDELTGIEPVQVLRYAARAIELAEALGARYEGGFVARLEPARSNLPRGGTGADVYRRSARGQAATPARVGATAALLALLDAPADVPGYAVRLPDGTARGHIVGEAEIRERATGSAASVPLHAERTEGGAPVARAGGIDFSLAALFGIQRERVLEGLGREAGVTALRTLEGVAPVLIPLLAEDTPLPAELALLLGWEAAEAIATALGRRSSPVASLVARAADLRRRGVLFPSDWLGPRIGQALDRCLGDLPATARDALALLDLVRATDVRVDLGAAQVRALAWWLRARPAPSPGDDLALLRERLGIAPEEDP